MQTANERAERPKADARGGAAERAHRRGYCAAQKVGMANLKGVIAQALEG